MTTTATVPTCCAVSTAMTTPGPASPSTLRVSVALGTSIPLVLATVRSVVIEAVADQVGVTVASIDIAVEDVHEL